MKRFICIFLFAFVLTLVVCPCFADHVDWFGSSTVTYVADHLSFADTRSFLLANGFSSSNPLNVSCTGYSSTGSTYSGSSLWPGICQREAVSRLMILME